MTKLLKAPALHMPAFHMVVLGGLAFLLLSGRQAATERPRVEIPAHRVEELVQGYFADTGQVPSRELVEQMVETLIDDEVLYQYALTLGMHENSAAQARLEQIAEFVEANPHGEHGRSSRAAAALELGLHHGDLVTRRILTDSARRLIRAVVLLQTPAPQRVEAFLVANRAEFEMPAEVRLVQIAINAFKWPDSGARAREVLAAIESRGLDRGAALAWSDEAPLAQSVPLVNQQALANLFDRDFAAAAFAAPVGSWSGPVQSRYGHHLILVEEKVPERLPALAEIHASVEEKLRQKLADEWLSLRLKELRAEFEIVAPGRTS
jgi:PPIC-type PPIASE domain